VEEGIVAVDGGGGGAGTGVLGVEEGKGDFALIDDAEVADVETEVGPLGGAVLNWFKTSRVGSCASAVRKGLSWGVTYHQDHRDPPRRRLLLL